MTDQVRVGSTIRVTSPTAILPYTLFRLSDAFVHKEEIDRYADLASYAQWKWLIARSIQPTRIAEIGVRSGVSMHAFMSASVPTATYVGYDNHYDPQPNAGGRWTDHAMKIATEERYNDRVRIITCDSQSVNALPEVGRPDFIHIDGDHTVDGVIHDLDLAVECWADNGVICVDDCSRNNPGSFMVAVGVFYWLTRPGRYLRTMEIHSKNGDLLIFNSGAMHKMLTIKDFFMLDAVGELNMYYQDVNGIRMTHTEYVRYMKANKRCGR